MHPEFFAGKPYVNRGISGQTTPQMLDPFPAGRVALQPAAVVTYGHQRYCQQYRTTLCGFQQYRFHDGNSPYQRHSP